MARPKRGRKAQRGNLEVLGSGAIRVRVYAGVDPLTGRAHYLKTTIPAGPDALDLAERERIRLLNQVDEGRNPRTKATVNQLMDRYLEMLDVDISTRNSYEGYIRNHIRPLIGKIPVGRLDGETLDSFFTILRTCRAHCGGRTFFEHRTKGPHECDSRCGPHKCKPLSTSAIRQIRGCLSGALTRAVRWMWLTVNPLDQAESPKAVSADPRPPTAQQAAAIVNAAFKDLMWGTLVWLAMVTGARRGELCALRWDNLDLDKAVLTIRASIGQRGNKTWEKDTKTHQQRRISLDPVTISLLRHYWQRCEALAAEMDVALDPGSRMFSLEVDHSAWIKPDTVTQRYRRMCARLGWNMHIHQLRHYSATELISSGVDVRTVAGRLGHGGGGSTTLRIYTAWVSEADQRAAGDLGGRMPAAPITIDDQGVATTSLEPDASNPYQQIAADLRSAIACGALQVGDRLPPVAELASRYNVSFGTAQRAIALLKDAGLINVSRGKRAVVAAPKRAQHQVADMVNLQGISGEVSPSQFNTEHLFDRANAGNK